MNIGFDAKKAIVNRTGIGNYSRRVIESLSAVFPADEFFLFGPRKTPAVPIMSSGNINKVFPPAFGGKITYELWRNMFLRGSLRENNIDVYHGLSNEIPLGLNSSKVKTIVTIHDLIFLTRPETFKSGMRIKLQKKTYYACTHADRIVAISQRTADDIVNLYGINSERIDIVYQSINPIYFQRCDAGAKDAILKSYSLPEKFVLCVGTIEQRKNQELLIKALPRIESGVSVVIAGRSTPYQQQLEDLSRSLGVANRVKIINGIPDSDLPALYQTASVVCLPSIYEGFGLPIAEALASNVPVVAATGSCLEEAGGPNSMYVNPYDEHALAEAVNEIISNQALRLSMIQQGANYVKRFSDTAMAENLMNVYKRACLVK